MPVGCVFRCVPNPALRGGRGDGHGRQTGGSRRPQAGATVKARRSALEAACTRLLPLRIAFKALRARLLPLRFAFKALHARLLPLRFALKALHARLQPLHVALKAACARLLPLRIALKPLRARLFPLHVASRPLRLCLDPRSAIPRSSGVPPGCAASRCIRKASRPHPVPDHEMDDGAHPIAEADAGFEGVQRVGHRLPAATVAAQPGGAQLPAE